MRPGSPDGRRVPQRAQGGFTLLEAALALLLLSLLAAGLMPLLAVGDQAYQQGWRRQDMLRHARLVLDRMVRDFQAAVTVRQASAGILRFDVVTQAGFQTVEYALQPDGDITYRVVGAGPPQPLAGPFASFQMACYDGTGVPVSCAQGALVRQLELQLEAQDPQPDPALGALAPLRVSTRVARRVP